MTIVGFGGGVVPDRGSNRDEGAKGMVAVYVGIFCGALLLGVLIGVLIAGP